MAFRDRLSAGATGSSVRNFIVGEKSTFKTTDDVLRAEYDAIWGGDTLPYENFEAAYRKKVQEKKQAALCLSGGGIRSAAFSLGVLQVLARRGLLTQFHYLSTVSGGGYIGGWLSRWIAKANQDAAAVENELARREEIFQVSSLRANSNFLTPKTGLTSADTWTGILLWVRNVLLNWTVFIPALFFGVLAPNLYLALMTWVAALAQNRATLFGQDLAVVLLWIATLGLTIATWQGVRNMPSHRTGADPSSRAIGWQAVMPLLLWAGLAPLVLVAGGYKLEPELEFQMFGASHPILFWLLVFSFGAKIVGYVIALITNPRNFFLYLRNFLTWVIVVAVATGALWFAIWVIEELSTLLPAKSHLLMSAGAALNEQVAAVVFALSILGPLGATLAHLLLSTLYVGFRHTDFQDDADREWLARLSAVSVFPTLLWAMFALICLFLPFVFIDNEWLRKLAPTLGPTIDTLGKAFGVISGFVAVLGGKSASHKPDISSVAPKSSSAHMSALIVRLATLFFIVFLLMVLAYAERMTAEKLVSTAQAHNELSAIGLFVIPRLLVFLTGFVPVYLLWYFVSREMAALIVAVLALFVLSALGFFSNAIGLWVIDKAHSPGKQIMMAQGFIATALFLIITVAAMKIDVNRFSMHGVYRNRLVRAFLGGARAGRKADPFTDFDPADNHRVSELRAQKDGRRVLYPVVNVTLNLVGGENLAWQERKASSFIITPLFCGSAALGNEVLKYATVNNPRRWTGAYIETEDYGGKEPELNDNKTGISLGTAITISGAAASPSMGYSSEPATAFLMTLFNVRLGAWLANPAAGIAKEEVKAGPTSALKPLLTEALGLTDAKSENVYLSDGGHFDNLGIYEMIRRRCRYILVVDADADETFAFEDLARSVRFACIDLDAKIEFDAIKMKPAREAMATSDTFAIGKITYAESSADPSWLIYIKPTYFPENAPIDVRSYGMMNATFPHETTLDQWFGESQFESYRRLGEYLMSRLYEQQVPKMTPKLAAGAKKGHMLEQFFTAATSPAPPSPPSPGGAGSTVSKRQTPAGKP
jgi:Patatin-like phospholipase